MPVVKLSNDILSNQLHCPPDKARIELCDADVRGLYVLVTAASPGQGAFFLRYKDSAKKTCHHRIGHSADITLSEARKEARRLKAEIALGGDLKVDNCQVDLNFDDFFSKHYLAYVSPRKRSWQRDEELYRLRVKPVFGKKPIAQITRKQIQQFHTDLLKEGLAPATCDLHLKVIRHALNLGIEWGMLELNPANRIPLFKVDNQIEHYMSHDELERLLHVLRTGKNRPVCCIALFLLSTGARLNEALQAKRSQIDTENRVWRIPATNSKSKRIRAVPLNDSALDVLKQLGTEGGDFLFINPKTKEPYTTIHKSWGRIKTKAGLPNLRIHDLRHQYASFLVNSGRTLYEVQQILGHSDPIVTMRYAHLSTKTLQDAANSASVMIKSASPATDSADAAA